MWYIATTSSGRTIRISTKTESKSEAKIRLREYEDQQSSTTVPFTDNSIGQILTAYIDHLKIHNEPGRVIRDIPMLRDMFGEVCDDLKPKSRHQWALSKGKEKKAALAKDPKDPRYQVIKVDSLEQLTTPMISDWLSTQVKGRGLSNRSANRRREILSALCSFAQNQRGVIWPRGVSPIKGVKKYREERQPIKFMHMDEIQVQLDHLKTHPQMQTMVAMYIFAGLRRDELLWLTAADIDVEKRLIHVRAKTVCGESWKTKTKTNRSVRINSRLLSYLQEYTRRPSFGDWFFPSTKGYRWESSNFNRRLREKNAAYRDPSGRHRPLRWGPKIYRHTYATQLAANGASLFQIAKLMGNSHGICERYYAEFVMNTDRDVTEFGSNPAPVTEQGQLKIG